MAASIVTEQRRIGGRGGETIVEELLGIGDDRT